MRVLIFGAEGMLGAAMMAHLVRIGADVHGTTLSGRGSADAVLGVDVVRPVDVDRAFERVSPDVAVNCAGIVKSECSQHDPDRVLAVNGRAPHAMAESARSHGARFVQVSTDCVFSGRRGSYRETDPTDAEDLYGQSKVAGEITDRPDCLTIRTSFIGRDPRRRRGLLEWLLAAQEGSVVPGFVRALWSGLSAPELARAITLAFNTPDLSGLYQVVGPTVSKAELLEVLVREIGLGCRVDRVDGEAIDRTLDGSRFTAATGYAPPAWIEMAKGLVNA